MKSRLFACVVPGLACTLPVWAGAQGSGGDAGRAHGAFVSGPPAYAGGSRHAMPLDQITANMRAAGLQPLSRPILRGAVYYVRAVTPARAEMRVALDARSGRVHRRRGSLDLQRSLIWVVAAMPKRRHLICRSKTARCRRDGYRTRPPPNLRVRPASRLQNPSWFRLRRLSSNEKRA